MKSLSLREGSCLFLCHLPEPTKCYMPALVIAGVASHTYWFCDWRSQLLIPTFLCSAAHKDWGAGRDVQRHPLAQQIQPVKSQFWCRSSLWIKKREIFVANPLSNISMNYSTSQISLKLYLRYKLVPISSIHVLTEPGVWSNWMD